MFAQSDLSQLQFPDLRAGQLSVVEPTPESIINSVAVYFGICAIALKGRKKYKSLQSPRQIAMYICLQFTSCNLAAIGVYFDLRDAKTVRAHCLKLQKDMQENSFVKSIVNDLSQGILRNTNQN